MSAIATIKNAINAKPGSFRGIRPDWAETAPMRDFLAADDPGLDPRFTLHRPTLVVQGTNDAFAYEQVDAAFVTNARNNGSSIDYKVFPGADHFSLIKASNADVMSFLAQHLPR